MSSKEPIFSEYNNCTLCPRNCYVNRNAGQTGYCNMSSQLILARAALHHWEEPCISGNGGSGTVFFTGCSLHCVYCQNFTIAHQNLGKETNCKYLSNLFIDLQRQGAWNINLVTASHFLPHVVDALLLAKQSGLTIPIVYNSSGYESVESLKKLEGLVSVYLPDFKYFSSDISAKYSKAPDYFNTACLAVQEMLRQTGVPEIDERGRMVKGVIIRHLVLPGYSADTKKILRYLHQSYGNSVWISIMNQYTPLRHVINYPELNRPVTFEEYEKIIDFAVRIGIEKAYIQEGDTVSESFIPAFNTHGI